MLKKTAETVLETSFGDFQLRLYAEEETGKEHVVLFKSWADHIPLVRIHSKCLTGDTFASKYCDCGQQLHLAMLRIQEEGGVLIYLDQEGRGVGLTNKIKAYELQRKGMDTVEANLFLGRENDEREYGIAVTILRDFDLSTVKLLTNNPLKVEALRKEGFRVEKFPIQVELDSERGKRYLKAKREKLGHE